MRRLMMGLLCIVVATSVAAQRRPGTGRTGGGNGGGGGTAAAGEPLRDLTAEEREAFDEGHEDFIEEEDVDGGLGPFFNEPSCLECHNVPAAGGGSARLVTRFARRTGGIFDSLATRRRMLRSSRWRRRRRRAAMEPLVVLRSSKTSARG